MLLRKDWNTTDVLVNRRRFENETKKLTNLFLRSVFDGNSSHIIKLNSIGLKVLKLFGTIWGTKGPIFSFHIKSLNEHYQTCFNHQLENIKQNKNSLTNFSLHRPFFLFKRDIYILYILIILITCTNSWRGWGSSHCSSVNNNFSCHLCFHNSNILIFIIYGTNFNEYLSP